MPVALNIRRWPSRFALSKPIGDLRVHEAREHGECADPLDEGVVGKHDYERESGGNDEGFDVPCADHDGSLSWVSSGPK